MRTFTRALVLRSCNIAVVRLFVRCVRYYVLHARFYARLLRILLHAGLPYALGCVWLLPTFFLPYAFLLRCTYLRFARYLPVARARARHSRRCLVFTLSPIPVVFVAAVASCLPACRSAAPLPAGFCLTCIVPARAFSSCSAACAGCVALSFSRVCYVRFFRYTRALRILLRYTRACSLRLSFRVLRLLLVCARTVTGHQRLHALYYCSQFFTLYWLLRGTHDAFTHYRLLSTLCALRAHALRLPFTFRLRLFSFLPPFTRITPRATRASFLRRLLLRSWFTPLCVRCSTATRYRALARCLFASRLLAFVTCAAFSHCAGCSDSGQKRKEKAGETRRDETTVATCVPAFPVYLRRTLFTCPTGLDSSALLVVHWWFCTALLPRFCCWHWVEMEGYCW